VTDRDRDCGHQSPIWTAFLIVADGVSGVAARA
jgi:hypothetical protein